ncbi:MAG: sulfate transporter, inner rane subunit [Thermomicrobiales bacterium]|nr:sulfate transporter, inner rane subunit [Thermomicrobiales bacterium]
MTSKLGLRGIALAYLGLLVAGPVAIMIWQTFSGGFSPVWEALTSPAFLHALKLTLIITAIAVPLNTIFGILFALVIVRREFRGKQVLTALLDLPLGVSPVVVGLALIIVYGRRGEFGGWLADHGIRVIFALPGMVLATIFVCIPFVAREVIPVLREIGTEQEQAARTLGASDWQIFRLVTFPAIRTGVAFGVVLTVARALGEYGAVAIVSGKLSGRTESLTVHVEERFLAFDMTGAYTASLVLAGGPSRHWMTSRSTYRMGH